MNDKPAFVTLLFSVLALNSLIFASDTTIQLEGPYLGQTPPSSIPLPFAPGIVTSEHFEYGGVFSPDMREFYLMRNGGKYESPTIVVFESKNDIWQESVVESRGGQPFIAPDGQTMHLGLYFRERHETGWSERKSLGHPFADYRIMRLTASSQGTFVFDEVGNDGDGIIRYSRLIDGQRQAPRPLSDKINSGTWNAHPFIAPDESYLLWDGKRDTGYGDSDIYISFRQEDGSWGAAINLGNKINTPSWDASASVTPDGKFLFFHRETSPGNLDIYWVDAQIIQTLRPTQ